MRAISKYKPPGGLNLEERFNGGFLALRVWGACIWRGLYMEGLIFGILRYFTRKLTASFKCVLRSKTFKGNFSYLRRLVGIINIMTNAIHEAIHFAIVNQQTTIIHPRRIRQRSNIAIQGGKAVKIRVNLRCQERL